MIANERVALYACDAFHCQLQGAQAFRTAIDQIAQMDTVSGIWRDQGNFSGDAEMNLRQKIGTSVNVAYCTHSIAGSISRIAGNHSERAIAISFVLA